MAPKPNRLAIIFAMVAKLFAKATTKLGLATTIAALWLTVVPITGVLDPLQRSVHADPGGLPGDGSRAGRRGGDRAARRDGHADPLADVPLAPRVSGERVEIGHETIGTAGAPSLAQRILGRSAAEVARDVGVPEEAVTLAWASEIVDLHIDSFIPARLYQYDLHKRHSYRFPLMGRLFGHLDLPRALGGGLTGGMWSISTNITRRASRRSDVFAENLAALESTLSKSPDVAVVTSASEWRAARLRGQHAALIVVQGGNAFESRAFENPGGLVTRVTVVHLSDSVFGTSSASVRTGGDDRGLTDRGREFVRWLDSERIFVDLAHASPRAFWDAVEVHDRTRPLIVTHTGIAEVHRMWRNVDAAQVKAVADTGGVVAVVFHRAFLGPWVRDGRAVIDHLEAVIAAGGEDCAALGSDYDGFIVPPPDLQDGGAGFYRLVAYMLERRWTEKRIRKVLGDNFVQSFARLRP
jgi:membrane dipeptidase